MRLLPRSWALDEHFAHAETALRGRADEHRFHVGDGALALVLRIVLRSRRHGAFLLNRTATAAPVADCIVRAEYISGRWARSTTDLTPSPYTVRGVRGNGGGAYGDGRLDA